MAPVLAPSHLVDSVYQRLMGQCIDGVESLERVASEWHQSQMVDFVVVRLEVEEEHWYTSGMPGHVLAPKIAMVECPWVVLPS